MIILILIIFSSAACSQRKQTKNNDYNPIIDPTNFVKNVNNKYFTLIPGRTLVYEGSTDEGTERIEVTVLKETKKVMGVEAMVIWDRVWLNGELVEDTKDWFAQDNKGNVWYFGEDSKEYENGKVKNTKGSWEAGVDGARPGIVMKADPKVGDKYRQEYYEGEAEDMGEVLAVRETITAPYGKFDNCLKTKDWSPLEPGAVEHKYYSPDIGGMVLEKAVDSDEKVELVEVRND